MNLLVGKNNSGKTALLEGIQFLTSGGEPSVLSDAASRRGELIFSRPDVSSPTVDIAHFFHGHALNLESTVTFQGDNGYHPVAMKMFSQKAAPDESGKVRPQGFFLRISGGAVKRAERDEPRFQISSQGGVDFDGPPRFRRIPNKRSGPPVRFISPDSLTSVDLALMWDEVTVSKQEAEVADAMRVLDEDLETVHILTGMMVSGFFPSRGGVVVGIKGQDGRLPLGSMGDGMRRLMSLATALAFTKGGCLFVDEIDTGLHYSVMADMWKLIVSKAVKSNTQVFATTHSWDCLEGMSVLCQQSPEFVENLAIHKIDRSLDSSVCFNGDMIPRMVKAHIDPR